MQKINIGEKDYFKIEVITVNQKDTQYYVGVLNVESLFKVFTVEPLLYHETTYRYSDLNIENTSYMEIKSRIDETKQNRFQRYRDQKRVNQIGDYVMTQHYSLFPNSIITASKSKNDYIDVLYNPENLTPEQIIEFNSVDGIYHYNNHLFIPVEENSILIIDGQHRVYGFEKIDQSVRSNYDLIISFLTGFDNSVLAQLFYTINSTQKSVDKSLLYHLASEFSDNLSEFKLLHEFLRFLNENDASPFLKGIKMLGKSQGFISQAFMIDMLLPLLLSSTKRSKTIPIFRYLYKSETDSIIILNCLIRYFIAVQKLLDDTGEMWTTRSSIFTKTTGIGALCKILPKVILRLLASQNELSNPININNLTISDYKSVLLPILDVDPSPYTSAGSYGLITKLAQDLENRLEISLYNKEFVNNLNLKWITSFID